MKREGDAMDARGKKILVGAPVMAGCTSAAYMTFSNYLVPLSQSINATVGQTTLFFMGVAAAMVVIALFFGKLLARFTVRSIVLFAAACHLGAFALLAVAHNLSVALLASVFLGASTVLAGLPVAQAEITWWFEASRTGRLLSLINIAIGSFSIIVSPLVALSLQAVGLSATACAQGAIDAALIVVCGVFLLPEKPEALAAGEGARDGAEADDAGGLAPAPHAVRTAGFWFVMLAVALLSLATTGFTNVSSAFYQEMGTTSVEASLCISIRGVAVLAWAALYGVLVDKMGPGPATLICGAAAAAAYFASGALVGFAGAVLIAIVVASLTMSANVGAVTLPRLFGIDDIGTLLGYVSIGFSLGSMLGAPIAGAIFDAVESYQPFMIFAGLLILAAVACEFAALRWGRKRTPRA